jgi:hypothetical protein
VRQLCGSLLLEHCPIGLLDLPREQSLQPRKR